METFYLVSNTLSDESIDNPDQLEFEQSHCENLELDGEIGAPKCKFVIP